MSVHGDDASTETTVDQLSDACQEPASTLRIEGQYVRKRRQQITISARTVFTPAQVTAMSNRCEKAGAFELLAEFRRIVGSERTEARIVVWIPSRVAGLAFLDEPIAARAGTPACVHDR